jgi:DNA invertase Pin-like site-specific DNA recombinase
MLNRVTMALQTRSAGIYARESKDKTKSIDDQAAECLSDCQQHGWPVAARYSDGSSASRFAKRARDDWPKLLVDLDAGRFGVLVLWESSRGTREPIEWFRLLATCRARRVFIHVVCHGRTYDLARARDWRTLAEDGVDAAYETERMSERLRRGKAASAAKGRPAGKLLYGYRRTYDDRGAFVAQVVNDAQAAVVREAAKRVAAGEPPHAVARDFNARGIHAPRGGEWNLTQVRRLVTNPAYIAQRVHRGQIIGVGQWPAILDEQTYWRCVTRVTDPARRTTRESAIKHLLSGIAECAVCDTPVKVQKNRTHIAYLCPAAFHVSIKTTLLDDYVSAVAVERLSRPDALELLAGPDGSDDAAQAAAEAAEKRVRLDGFYDAAARGELTPAALVRIEQRLLPEIEAADRRSRQVRVSPVLRELARPDVAELWAGLPITVRREVISTLMRVRVRPTVRGSRRFDPERVEIEWLGEPT